MPPLDIAPPQLGMGLGMPNIGLPATDNFGGGLSSLSGENIKITDSDLKPLLQEVNESYNVSFNV